MKPTPYNSYNITFANGKQRNLKCTSVLEAFCDSVLFAMSNAWEPAITEILEVETGKKFKSPSVNLLQCN